MALVIKNNMSAVNTLNKLDANAAQMAKNLEKVSTGMKINSAGDDASGYAISEKMRVQARSLGQDDMNAQNAISMLTVAEGAVQSTVDELRIMKEKAIDAANDSNTDADRAIIQKTIDQSISQIEDNAYVEYNGIAMLDGSHNDAVVEGGTYTHMTNMSLSASTTIDMPLIDLKDRSNNSLGIDVNDQLNVSWVKNGVTTTVSITPLTYETYSRVRVEDPDTGIAHFERVPVQHDYTLKALATEIPQIGADLEFVDGSTNGYSYIGTDAAGDEVRTVGGENGITVKAKEPGVDGQLAGFTLTVLDMHGQPKRAVNAALDNFMETIRAQNASQDNALVFQIGTKANQALKVGCTDMRATALGLICKSAETSVTEATEAIRGATVITARNSSNTLNVSTQEAANAAINVLDNALQRALNQQTKLGAEASRLEYTSANITIANENTQASESVIRDADMAKEHMNYTKSSILTQAAQAMLAQANQNSSQVLSLLQG